MPDALMAPGRAWPDTRADLPPYGDRYAGSRWLLGRYPRLADLAARVAGVVDVDDGECIADIDHLGDVFAAIPRWSEAWEAFERRCPPPRDDLEYEAWQARGPKPDEFELGMSDVLVMSSGEVASLRLLAALARAYVPFRVSDLASLDAEGRRIVADWCRLLTDA